MPHDHQMEFPEPCMERRTLDIPVLTKGKKFKLLHKPSGLFYRPNNGFMGIAKKTPNLSKRGKTYTQPPRVNEKFTYRDRDGEVKKAKIEEWEIVEIKK